MFSNFQELNTYVRENGIKMLDFKIPELTGNWRHLTIPADGLTETVFTEGFGFDGSNYGYKRVEASDMIFIPDLQTAFLDPFWEQPTLSFMVNIYEIKDGEQVLFGDESRNILKKALNYLQKTGVADQFVVGPEFEYYLLDRINYWNYPQASGYSLDSRQAGWNSDQESSGQGYQIGCKDGYHKDAPYDLYRDLRSEITLALTQLGIKIKYHHHEVGGPGQHEIEVERGEAFSLADASMLIKYFVKNMAYARGKTATFMPKPIYAEAGSGFHIHLQLAREGKSLFNGSSANCSGLSRLALNFMGGILVHTPALMALAAPTTNSYKRLVKGYEAPVAICFAASNRSAVIRIPGYATSPEDKRFEFRPGDATGNPYLTFAAILLAGMDGIEKQIDPIKEGYGPIDKNVYHLTPAEEQQLNFLPASLEEALQALESDQQFLRKEDIFSGNLIKNWLEIKRKESREINQYPIPKEFELYYDA